LAKSSSKLDRRIIWQLCAPIVIEIKKILLTLSETCGKIKRRREARRHFWRSVIKMNKLAKLSQFNRTGAVYYRVEQQSEDGIAAISLSVDFERAPEPDRSYVADYFEIHRTDADVMLVFGKMDFPSQTKLRNKIEIYFPIHPFMQQLWKTSRKMHKSLREQFQKKGKQGKQPGNLDSSGVVVQTLTSNNALIVLSGGQCVMDFFLINAKDLWLKTRKGDPLNLDAIVRVFTNEHIVLGLLDCFDALAQELNKEFDVPVTEEDDETVESLPL
jgi:hypothetical protein